MRRNRKRKPVRSSVLVPMVAVLVAATAAGTVLWHHLEDTAEKRPAPRPRLSRTAHVIDVGRGRTADPTLVREKELLAVESSPLEADPTAEAPSAESPDAGQVAPSDVGSGADADDPRFPLHGVAFEFHTQVFAEPRPGARAIGYARRGATFRLSEIVSRNGCARGWHEIAGGGVFVCSGQGVNVAKNPIGFSPSPPPPSETSAMPYAYAYVSRDSVPQFWRIPTAEERLEISRIFDRLARTETKSGADETLDREALRRVLARAAAFDANAPDGGTPGQDAGMPSEDSGKPEHATSPPARLPAPSPVDAGLAGGDDLPPYVHMRMAKGFFVSVDGEVKSEDGVTYQRTIRGRFIPADSLVPAKPSAHESPLVDDANPLPRAFTIQGGVKMLRSRVEGGPLRAAETVARLAAFPVLGETTRGDRAYVRVSEDAFLPRRAVAIASVVPLPASVKPAERWIDIDLDEQTLVAYEGAQPVFATVVSTGRPGFETPEGEFRIYAKHVSITMDDTDAGDEAYSIEDVPWTMFFKDSLALHAAFWHDRFGRPRSHGCVNLAPADAKRLFHWVGPRLPRGLHGIAASRGNPGTRVFIHR